MPLTNVESPWIILFRSPEVNQKSCPISRKNALSSLCGLVFQRTFRRVRFLSWTYCVLKVSSIGAELKIFDLFFCFFLKQITCNILLLIFKIFLQYCLLFRCSREEMAQEGAEGCLTNGEAPTLCSGTPEAWKQTTFCARHEQSTSFPKSRRAGAVMAMEEDLCFLDFSISMGTAPEGTAERGLGKMLLWVY